MLFVIAVMRHSRNRLSTFLATACSQRTCAKLIVFSVYSRLYIRIYCLRIELLHARPPDGISACRTDGGQLFVVHIDDALRRVRTSIIALIIV